MTFLSIYLYICSLLQHVFQHCVIFPVFIKCLRFFFQNHMIKICENFNYFHQKNLFTFAVLPANLIVYSAK